MNEIWVSRKDNSLVYPEQVLQHMLLQIRNIKKYEKIYAEGTAIRRY